MRFGALLVGLLVVALALGCGSQSSTSSVESSPSFTPEAQADGQRAREADARQACANAWNETQASRVELFGSGDGNQVATVLAGDRCRIALINLTDASAFVFSGSAEDGFTALSAVAAPLGSIPTELQTENADIESGKITLR